MLFEMRRSVGEPGVDRIGLPLEGRAIQGKRLGYTSQVAEHMPQVYQRNGASRSQFGSFAAVGQRRVELPLAA